LTQKAITATQNKSSSSMRDVSHRCAGQHFEQSYFSMQPSENYCQGNETGERGSPGQPGAAVPTLSGRLSPRCLGRRCLGTISRFVFCPDSNSTQNLTMWGQPPPAVRRSEAPGWSVGV